MLDMHLIPRDTTACTSKHEQDPDAEMRAPCCRLLRRGKDFDAARIGMSMRIASRAQEAGCQDPRSIRVLFNDSHLALYFESLECRRHYICTHYRIIFNIPLRWVFSVPAHLMPTATHLTPKATPVITT
jgi:hypothetical protein